MDRNSTRFRGAVEVGPPGTSARLRCARCGSPIRLDVGAGVREVPCGTCGATTRIEVAHNGLSWQARRLKD